MASRRHDRWADPRLKRTGVVVGMAALVLAGSAATGTYTIQRGDTLSLLAKRTGTSVSALAAANGIRNPHHIVAGQRLVVPGGGAASAATSATYVVRAGESLSQIARRHGVTVEALAAANGITDVSHVMAGSRLRLGGAPSPAPGASRGTSTHVVRSGETLSEIARRHGTTTAALAAANGIANPNRLRAGTRLTVTGHATWLCPVQGRPRFVNDFGVPKPDGRFHDGIDLFAPNGTPVVASVGGRVEQIDGTRGGLQYWLYGDDGMVYIGTHLDRLGAAGRVPPGAVLGYVGTSGNARGTSPHLHFEVHPRAASEPAVNPYPALRVACGG